jgi:hypothetical protein
MLKKLFAPLVLKSSKYFPKAIYFLYFDYLGMDEEDL